MYFRAVLTIFTRERQVYYSAFTGEFGLLEESSGMIGLQAKATRPRLFWAAGKIGSNNRYMFDSATSKPSLWSSVHVMQDRFHVYRYGQRSTKIDLIL
jgi:hypothetical protein